MKREEQLQRWLEGSSEHNKEMDECCPDFACCIPEIDTPHKMKVSFSEAYRAKDLTAMGILNASFMGAVMAISNDGHEKKNRRTITYIEANLADTPCFVKLMDKKTDELTEYQGKVTGVQNMPHQGITVHVDVEGHGYFLPIKEVFVGVD